MNVLKGMKQLPVIAGVLFGVNTDGYAQDVDKIMSEHDNGFYRQFYQSNYDCSADGSTIHMVNNKQIQGGKLLVPGKTPIDISKYTEGYCNELNKLINKQQTQTGIQQTSFGLSLDSQ